MLLPFYIYDAKNSSLNKSNKLGKYKISPNPKELFKTSQNVICPHAIKIKNNM